MPTTKTLLKDYNYPLALINKNANPNLDLRSKERIWFSQPRLDTDPTWEVLRISLRKPILITSISLGFLSRDCLYEIWVKTNGADLQLTDSNLNPVKGTVHSATGSAESWNTIDVETNPVIITSLSVKIKRNVAAATGQLVSLGIRDLLMKRTVKTQADTLYSLGTTVDTMGNPVRREVQDWRPQLALDGNAFTFWKSAPQPSPEAVVNFYTTLGDGVTPKRVDRVFIDPVYTGQQLNMYYSTDPTVGTIAPQPQKVDSTLVGTDISLGKGVDLNGGSKSYTINTTSLLSQNGVPLNSIGATGWIGGEIEIGAGLSGDITIFQNPAATNFSLAFNQTSKVFTFTNNWTGHTGSVVVSNAAPFSIGDFVQFVVIISKDPVTNFVTLRLIVGVSGIINSDTSFSAITNDTFAHLYDSVSSLVFNHQIGFLRNLVVKVSQDSEAQYRSFITDPASFLRPQAVANQPKTYVKQSNIDNALLVGPYTTGEAAYGGLGEEFYLEKVWTPIWKDWIVQRGFYYLPTPIAACHLKLEFSRLTEQPYPIYETGVEVPYQAFPHHVTQTSTTDIIQSNPIAPTAASLAAQTPSTVPFQFAPKSNIVFGSKIVDNIRNRGAYDYRTLVTEQIRTSSLKAANASNPMDISSDTISQFVSNNTGNSDEPSTSALVNQNVIGQTTISSSPTKGLGIRTPSWWYLPGGLKVSAATMQQITQNSTSTERFNSSSETTTLRTRFTNQSIHKYDTKFAIRDVGLAYFAGLRDFQAFAIDNTVPVDSVSYDVLSFSDETESSTNMHLGVPGSIVGSYAADPLAADMSLGQRGQTIFKTWNSIATFIKAGITTVDRGFHSDTKGSDVEVLGLTNTGGFWDDSTATWSDSVNVWGSSTSLVGIDLQSNLYYQGRQAVKIYRAAGSGSGGVRTRVLDLVRGERVRLAVSVFRPVATGNTLTLQLEDTTAITGSVLFQEDIDVRAGVWTTIKTDWFTMPAANALLRVNFLISGTTEEVVYLSELYDQSTTIIYSASNDDGASYFEMTEILNDPNRFIVFPAPGNKLKIKVDCYDNRDYCYGFSVRPQYLF